MAKDIETIQNRMKVIELPQGGKIAAVPMKTKDVVTISGSITGGPEAFPQDKGALAIMTADLLDAGSGKLDRDGFRDALAARGAEVSFSADGTRLSFDAHCFPEDTRFVLERIRDAIFAPKLPPKELVAEKTRTLTELADQMNDTRFRAEHEAARLIYPAGHPHYGASLDDEKRHIGAATPAAAKGIAGGYGVKHLALAAAGDLNAEAFTALAASIFGKQPAGYERPAAKLEKSTSAHRTSIFIDGKANADTVLGARVGFNNKDARYMPLAVANHALGGSFASHLTQTVRERDGLTYGTYSRLVGFNDGLDGYLRIWGTFAPEMLAKGVETLEKETKIFLTSGMTEEKLASVKEELTGAYAVSLSTTAGLAMRLRRFMEDDRPLSWIDEYPDLIRAVSLKDAQAAAAHLDSLPLSVVTAGTAVLF